MCSTVENISHIYFWPHSQNQFNSIIDSRKDKLKIFTKQQWNIYLIERVIAESGYQGCFAHVGRPRGDQGDGGPVVGARHLTPPVYWHLESGDLVMRHSKSLQIESHWLWCVCLWVLWLRSGDSSMFWPMCLCHPGVFVTVDCLHRH